MPSYDKPDDLNDSDVLGHLPYLQLKTSSSLIVPQWSTNTIYGLVTAMVAAIFAAVGYEFLNEYSRHLRNRNIRYHSGSRCCGTEVFGCCDKLVLSILLMIRVVVGYFMMLCVMTMNIWLLISVVVGAGIGYCICKPLVANLFTDSVSSYEYPVVRIKTSDEEDDVFGGNVATRSQSWRFDPSSKRSMESTGKRLMESVLSEQELEDHRKSGDYSRYTLRPSPNQNAINVILIRERRPHAPNATDIKDEDDTVFIRNKEDKPETRTAFSQTLPASYSRFKSTSLVINQTLKPDKLKSQRQSRVKSETSSRSPKGSGRFKPISKVIIDQRASVDKV